MRLYTRRAACTTLAALAFAVPATLSACGGSREPVNLAEQNGQETPTIDFFSPMEKIDPDALNTAREAGGMTIDMAEAQTGISVVYNTYTAENYQDKTYDDVCIERARASQDDLYLLNPDVTVTLGREGLLADLSGLPAAANLREVVRAANTIDGRLVAIPQEVVAYGLFLNMDIFKECHLEVPNTPEEFIACCKALREAGYEAPVGANRWWLETFVFAQAYAEMYNGGDVEAEVAALNAGQTRYSDYLRPGFEFLKALIDEGYVDAEGASTSEAFEGPGEGQAFLDGECPIVMAYWGAANTETAYGKPPFTMEVVGFPSDLGQMPVLSVTGYGVLEQARHRDEALEVLNVIVSDEALELYSEINRVISPSENVKVECIDALKPLNALVEEDKFVLASNAGMNVEQWGNVCLIVRDLLGGASVEACMEALDKLQEDALSAQ